MCVYLCVHCGLLIWLLRIIPVRVCICGFVRLLCCNKALSDVSGLEEDKGHLDSECVHMSVCVCVCVCGDRHKLAT